MASDNRIDRPAPVRAGEELDLERLAEYLAAELGLATGDLEVEQFPAGYSNLTYRVHAGGREMVLRRPPFGSKVATAHDMGREHRILTALAGVYGKTPRPLAYCDDPAVLGAPFYLMERVEGVILRGSMAAGSVPDREAMRAVAGELLVTLAELHEIDPAGAGLAGLGRPEGYLERQIEGWTRRWEKSRTDEIAAMETVVSWLPGNAPPVERRWRPALIHNDFKYDNLVLDLTGRPRVIAVLDWEMATVGDPLTDLGTTLGYWIEAGDPPAMKALALSPTVVPGNPGRREVAERYVAARGGELDDGDLVFYYVLGLFKIAVIVQQIYYRYRRGHTADPRFAGLIDGVRIFARAAAQAIDRGRIDRLFD